MSKEIRVQVLEEGNFHDGKLYKLSQGSSLRLKLSSSLLHKPVIKVFSNVPTDVAHQFEREKYYQYEWTNPTGSSNDDFDKYIDLSCSRAGSYNYYFTFEDEGVKRGGSSFLVDPELRYSSGKSLDLNGLQIQTVLSKLLGPIDEWQSRLRVAKESGYNMIHFSPVQELSLESNSSYSIRNHLKLVQTATGNGKYGMDDLKKCVEQMYEEWGVLSISDLVYNHMAVDSEFLISSPDSAYNLKNSAHLIPAFILDRIFLHFTLDIANGVYENRSIVKGKIREDQLDLLRHLLRDVIIPKHKLYEFYMCDVEKISAALTTDSQIQLPEAQFIVENHPTLDNLKILQDPKYRRLQSTIDLKLGKYLAKKFGLDAVKSRLYSLNEEIRNRIESYLTEAVNNSISTVQYFFFAHDGPKWPEVAKLTPIVRNYFYFPYSDDKSVEEEELMAFNETNSRRIMACNGWVMGDDPLRNFASEDSWVYLRRQLIPWGDLVKLRFGDKPADSPELWAYMSEYTRITATIFHGVRLDNCHSTPIHAAQYFLDLARSIRPDLYVIAELFTNSEQIDNKFVKRLGITSLIRESMNAWNSNEQGRLVHRFSSDPVGSFMQPSVRPLVESWPHAIFYDQTHDNQPLIKSRSVYDSVASSSIVYMTKSAVGSVRGFDELVPHYIDVVKEARPYRKWGEEKDSVNLESGIIKAKKAMNMLHTRMGLENYSQTYVDQFDADTTVLTRHNPLTYESIILIGRTSFSQPSYEQHMSTLSRPLFIPGLVEKVLFETSLVRKPEGESYTPSADSVNGIQGYNLLFEENVTQSSFIDKIDYSDSSCSSNIYFKHFPPSAVCVFKCSLNERLLKVLADMKQKLNDTSKLKSVIADLTFDELNIVLYRCSNEEESDVKSGCYSLPNTGTLVYAGLQGVMNILERERMHNNLGHSLFENLRNGDWMLSYIVDRLNKYVSLQPEQRKSLSNFAQLVKSLFDLLSQIPRYLIPRYFDLIITKLYSLLIEHAFTLMSKHGMISNEKSSSFVKALSLGSVSLLGCLQECPLPDTIIKDTPRLKMSLSAGLPHFSASYMRNWGRDTFISLRGLLLLTGRFEDARNLILSFGSTMRHGLIPNLLGDGFFSRFNCRDAVWFWLKSIKDYTESAPNGIDILSDKIYRLYPNDDSTYPADTIKARSDASRIQTLGDLIQETLTIHANGLRFRERNAGQQIDEHMKDEGFNNEIGVDWNTGFVFGGNKFNCGTWMDKMGSSWRAGNKGIPATPRDGSAVELVALSRSILDWLAKLSNTSAYQFDGVQVASLNKKVTWSEWGEKIDANFEKKFWIGEDSNESGLVNKRNIYKDTFNSSLPWSDYQLRPNFLIALVVAPSMIRPENARKALASVRAYLLNEPNTIGIKTLDDSDFNYCGYYDNSNDTTDKRVANGFNYHNGPEWLWPVGFYLRAELMYSSDRAKTTELVKRHLGKLADTLFKSEWKSLPELTNKNGEVCHHGCPSQAWSLATILELYKDLAAF